MRYEVRCVPACRCMLSGAVFGPFRPAAGRDREHSGCSHGAAATAAICSGSVCLPPCLLSWPLTTPARAALVVKLIARCCFCDCSSRVRCRLLVLLVVHRTDCPPPSIYFKQPLSSLSLKKNSEPAYCRQD